MQLLNLQSLSSYTPKGLQNRVIFTVGILAAMRSTAMARLKGNQFTKMTSGANTVWKITDTLGYVSECSKTSSGEWESIGRTPGEVYVWNQLYMTGSIAFYSILDEYINLQDKVAKGCDRFFLADNVRTTTKNKVFKRLLIGKNSFLSVVKDCWAEENIKSSSTKSWIITHGLRGTLATILSEAALFDP